MKGVEGTYDVIYADPPWRYNDRGCEGAAERHYLTMPTEEICALPVKQIARRDAVLFMWATFPMLTDALRVIKAWGFAYKTCAFNWIKLEKTGGVLCGTGHYTRGNAEIVLLGVRGRIPRERADVGQIVMAGRREHSRKPEEVRRRIMMLYGPKRRYIELFARERAPGWEAWGNEVEKFDGGAQIGLEYGGEENGGE